MKRPPPGKSAHEFGGDWTSKKLDVIADYLKGYTTALRNQKFRTAYIDAFAGTGYRTLSERAEDPSGSLLFPDLAENAPQRLLDGSARRALQVRPRFDKYIFIERSAERCASLESLRGEFSEIAEDISVLQGDANDVIRRMCTKTWRARRAVLFLDPYGMQVEWDTIEATAATRAIDMWVLFPLGIGVNRLVTKSGLIPPAWRAALNRLLGSTDWEQEFYRHEQTTTLFGIEDRVVKASTDVIGRYFNQRLASVFPGVSESPGVLRNSTGCPLYLLCFAAANPVGAPIALKIADHLLKGVR